ncbi:hypothetical protein YSA_07261 [Pseudomonas putida ND6]|uniref:Uncharacterized protein n=1 Tax=Pseudomonas putida ND6 TaxID=231023 RepID=I3UYX2_PSEPU|nr:hypothetical protein YSA_07261 [Pseudomonas putida ND6]
MLLLWHATITDRTLDGAAIYQRKPWTDKAYRTYRNFLHTMTKVVTNKLLITERNGTTRRHKRTS